jgi:hypothetical protein
MCSVRHKAVSSASIGRTVVHSSPVTGGRFALIHYHCGSADPWAPDRMRRLMNLRRELGGCTTPASQRSSLHRDCAREALLLKPAVQAWPGISHPWQRPPPREPVSCQAPVCRAPHPNPVGPGPVAALTIWPDLIMVAIESWGPEVAQRDPPTPPAAKEQFRLRVPSGVFAVQDDALAKERRGATGRCRSERRWVAAMRRSIAAR